LRPLHGLLALAVFHVDALARRVARHDALAALQRAQIGLCAGAVLLLLLGVGAVLLRFLLRFLALLLPFLERGLRSQLLAGRLVVLGVLLLDRRGRPRRRLQRRGPRARRRGIAVADLAVRIDPFIGLAIRSGGSNQEIGRASCRERV